MSATPLVFPILIFWKECSVNRSFQVSLLNLFPWIYVTLPGKRDHLGNFFKIELLLQQGRVGFELQNALHI